MSQPSEPAQPAPAPSPPVKPSWTNARYAVVDVEGNGQQPPDLVEVAIVPITDGRIGEPSTWLVKPPRPITPMARRVHQITNEQVAGCPAVAEVADDIRAHLDPAVSVAHNAHVDLGVLTRELPGFTPFHGVIDTLKLARTLIAGQASYKLGRLVDDLALADGLPDGLSPHRATYDALVCARLLVHLAAPRGGVPFTLSDLLTTPAMVGGECDEPPATLF